MQIDPKQFEVVSISMPAAEIFEAHIKRGADQEVPHYLFIDAREMQPVIVAKWIKDLYDAEDKAEAEERNIPPLLRVAVLASSSQVERELQGLNINHIDIVVTQDKSSDAVDIFNKGMETVYLHAMQPPPVSRVQPPKTGMQSMEEAAQSPADREALAQLFRDYQTGDGRSVS